MRARLHELIRPIAVYLIALIGLCALAGQKRLLEPSHDNHYSHLAQSWLDGRLDHEGKPPHWCTPELSRAKKCRQSTANDWARVWTLELRDGSSVRGFPCKTQACQQLRRQGVEGWLVAGSYELLEIPRREIVKREETWYVSFPPGPALVMLPVVAVWGTDAPDVLITCLFAALIPVVFLLWFDRERGRDGGRGREHLWAAAAWAFASPAAWVGSHGSVWFTAQVLRGPVPDPVPGQRLANASAGARRLVLGSGRGLPPAPGVCAALVRGSGGARARAAAAGRPRCASRCRSRSSAWC